MKAFRLKKHAIGCLILLQLAVCSYADSLTNITESCQNHIIYMLWFKFILGLMSLNWFQFYLPLFQIMVMNTRVVYKSRQPAKFAGFSARFRRLLLLLHESKYVEEMDPQPSTFHKTPAT